MVHDRDAGPSLVLLLSDFEEGNDGGLLVLGGVFGDDGLCDLLVLSVELKGDGGVVVRAVAVLQVSERSIEGEEERGRVRGRRRQESVQQRGRRIQRGPRW